MATVWLNKANDKTISDLMKFIKSYFRDNPIKAGVVNGKQKMRSRGKPLYTFVREYKDKNAPDCYSDDGEHFHICLTYSSAYSTPEFIRSFFNAAIEAGIVAFPTDSRPFPAYITGNHKLYETEGLTNAREHFRYMAKSQTKINNGLPRFGGSRLTKKETLNETLH